MRGDERAQVAPEQRENHDVVDRHEQAEDARVLAQLGPGVRVEEPLGLEGLPPRVVHLLAARVDPFLSVLLSVVMVKSGTRLILDNLRALLDLPLPEPEMLKVMKVLGEFFHSYDGLGRL